MWRLRVGLDFPSLLASASVRLLIVFFPAPQKATFVRNPNKAALGMCELAPTSIVVLEDGLELDPVRRLNRVVQLDRFFQTKGGPPMRVLAKLN